MAIEELEVRSYSRTADTKPVLRLIRGDEGTHIIRFIVPISPGGVNLTGMAWAVHTKNSEGITDAFFCSDVTESKDDIRCDWLIGGTATAAAGSTLFELEGGRTDPDGKQRVWQSDTYFIDVSDNLSGTPVIAPEQNGDPGDVLTRTENGMDWLPSAGSASLSVDANGNATIC